MVRANPPAPESIPNPAQEIHPLQEVMRFVRAVRHRKGVLAVTIVLGCLLGGLYYATATRVYESRASLLVMQLGQDTWSTGMSGERASRDLIATYRNMFASDVVVEDALKLLPPEHRVDFQNADPCKHVRLVQGNLAVHAVRDTNILNVSYRSVDPQAAAGMVNALLSAYLAFTEKLHKSTARELLDILTKEKHDLEAQLRVKETELLTVRSNAADGVIRDGQQGVNVVVRRAIKLNEALIAAHEKRLTVQSQLGAIQQTVRNGEDLKQHALAMIDSPSRDLVLRQLGLSDADTQAVARIQQQLLEDRAQLTSLLQLYGLEHRRVRQLQERIRSMEHVVRAQYLGEHSPLAHISNAELATLLVGIARQQFDNAVAHEKALHESYEQEKRMALGLDYTMAQLGNLENELARLRGFYDVVLQRVKDIDLGQENGMLRTSILSHPETPLDPVWPRRNAIALLSLALGLGAGLALVYLQDLLDDRFRSPEELRAQLGVPVLTMVRRLATLPENTGPEAIHAHVQPNGADSEAFRTLRTALALIEGGAERLVVSSSEPGDGKTTIVANLATVYAQSGKRTLLVDADMRRPGLTPLLDLKSEQGLSTVLRDAAPVGRSAEANIHGQVYENLDVLASGPRPVNPTELLASDRFSEFLAWAETHYDQVLIDSPPAMVSDTAIIGRLVDGVLLTVQPLKNRRRVVIRAAESFPSLGIKVLGIVVNRVAGEKEGDYYGYGCGYGYGYGYGHDDEDGGGDRTPGAGTTIVRRAA